MKLESLPARILLQIREGIPNALTEGELRIAKTRSLEGEPGEARFKHTVAQVDIVALLLRAARESVQEFRRTEGAEGEREKFEAWLAEMLGWVKS